MKILLLIALLLTTFAATAGEIVLLTSLKLHSRNVRHLEKKFNKAFQKSGHELVIEHKVGPKRLYEVMTSDETVAVIWVSHAAGESEVQPGMSAQDIVLDYFGNDVKNFFTLVPKNLRFLGLAGCQAQKIVNGFKARGNYDRYPELEILSFEKKVRLYKAFDQTVMALQKNLAAEKTPVVNASNEVRFDIERSELSAMPGMEMSWAEIGDQVLAFFDQGETGPLLESSIDENVLSKIPRKNIKLFRAKGEVSSTAGLGELRITSDPAMGSWTLFARDGRPIGGLDQQLYVFRKSQN